MKARRRPQCLCYRRPIADQWIVSGAIPHLLMFQVPRHNRCSTASDLFQDRDDVWQAGAAHFSVHPPRARACFPLHLGRWTSITITSQSGPPSALPAAERLERPNFPPRLTTGGGGREINGRPAVSFLAFLVHLHVCRQSCFPSCIHPCQLPARRLSCRRSPATQSCQR